MKDFVKILILLQEGLSNWKDTSVILEGSKVYVYKVLEDNTVKKTEIQIGLRNLANLEIISGLEKGDIIVAEGLKKVRPGLKIKPIKN